MRYAFCDGASGNGGVGKEMVVAVAAAAAAEAMVPLRMILCLQIVRFPCFLKRRNGPTYGRMDLRTDGPTDGRTDGPTDRPSYRDARTHLKMMWRPPLKLTDLDKISTGGTSHHVLVSCKIPSKSEHFKYQKLRSKIKN